MASGFGRKVSHLLIEGILFLGAIALIAYQIGTPSLFETSEGRFASIARTMVDSGDWLIPRFNGLVHLSKPPLAYWASAIGQNFFGFTETGARALLPLAAGLTILGCFRIGRLFMSMRGALISTFVLLTSLFFNVQFRGLTSDPFLAMFETWMVWALISYVLSPSLNRGMLFYLFAGFAMLTKGPPGLLPLLGLIPGLGIRCGWANLRSLGKLAWGWAIFVILGLSWFLLMCFRFQGAMSYFLLDETFNRVATTAHHRGGPWYYFIGVLLAGTFPWTLFFIGATVSALSGARDRKQPLGLATFLWIVVPLVIFSLSQSKLVAYALPLLIPASLITGRYLAPMLHLNEDEPLSYKLESSMTLFILGTFSVALLYCSWSEIIPDPRFARLALFLAAFMVFLTAFGYTFLSWGMAKGILLVLGFTVPGTMMFLMPGVSGNEEIAPGRFLPGYRDFLQVVGRLPATSTVICVNEMLESIPFYTGRAIPTWGVLRESRFDPELSKTFDLQGDEALRQVASAGAFFLAKRKDLPKVQPVVGFRLDAVAAAGPWGLFRPGPILATIRHIGSGTPVMIPPSPTEASIPDQNSADSTASQVSLANSSSETSSLLGNTTVDRPSVRIVTDTANGNPLPVASSSGAILPRPTASPTTAVEPQAKQPAKPSTKAAKPAKQPPKPPGYASATAQSKPPTTTTAKPVRKPAAKQVIKPVSKSAAKPVRKPIGKSAAKPFDKQPVKASASPQSRPPATSSATTQGKPFPIPTVTPSSAPSSAPPSTPSSTSPDATPDSTPDGMPGLPSATPSTQPKATH